MPCSTLPGAHDVYFVLLVTSCGQINVLLGKLGIVDLVVDL